MSVAVCDLSFWLRVRELLCAGSRHIRAKLYAASLPMPCICRAARTDCARRWQIGVAATVTATASRFLYTELRFQTTLIRRELVPKLIRKHYGTLSNKPFCPFASMLKGHLGLLGENDSGLYL